MSLKGYYWSDDNGKMTMMFTFKYLELTLYQAVPETEVSKAIEYIEQRGYKVNHISTFY